jgi:hypothetical protein
MSISVDLAELRSQVSRFGAGALLVTTSRDGPPHVSSVIVAFDGDNLAMPVGRTTRANTDHHPSVALVWTSANDEHYCLIVDATAVAVPTPTDLLVVEPQSAVLHRLATASDELPQCVRLDTA